MRLVPGISPKASLNVYDSVCGGAKFDTKIKKMLYFLIFLFFPETTSFYFRKSKMLSKIFHFISLKDMEEEFFRFFGRITVGDLDAFSNHINVFTNGEK